VGDPTEVSAAARTLQSIALDVAEISSRLRSLASGDWSGAAASSARARSATLPPKLDKANASYAAAGGALVTYARALADAQQQSQSAIANANRASDDLAAARAAQVAAAQSDAVAVAAAHASNTPPPLATAPRFEGAIEEAASRLARARALNEQAHELQTLAARTAGSALHQASHEGIHNASWFHHFSTAVGHWAATQWSHALRELSKIATVVSALAGVAALVLAVAGVLFPPLEAAAAVLETISLASAVVAGMADTVLAATGKASWNAVGIDALTLAPAGLGKIVTKVAPMLRESRLITPNAVVHASSGDAAKLRSLSTLGHPPGASYSRVVNCAPTGVDPEWGLTATHIDKHFLGEDPLSLSQIDSAGNLEIWLSHLRELATRPHTALRNDGIQDILGSFAKTDGSGSFRLGLRLSPKDDGTFDLVTLLTAQRRS
jgi:hypothetical protein